MKLGHVLFSTYLEYRSTHPPKKKGRSIYSPSRLLEYAAAECSCVLSIPEESIMYIWVTVLELRLKHHKYMEEED